MNRVVSKGGAPKCDIEFIDRTTDVEDGVHVMRVCRINGSEVWLPVGAEIRVEASPTSPTTVHFAICATSVQFIRGVDS